MSVAIPPLPPFQPQWGDFQVWWQLAKSRIDESFEGIESAIADIQAILDPNTLSPDKKPQWMFFYSYLTSEQSDIDAKATTYGITTEKTAYDSAVSALTSYLATLTTDVAWNDTSGNTTIVDATFRSNFTAVLTAKQALLNKMQASAKALADSAQTTATSASTTAAAVQRDSAIGLGWTAPGNVLSATDAGSNVTITIAAHTRKYGDATSVSVSGGTLTGLDYSTKYYVYYDDANRTGGSETYHATTDPNTSQPNAATGRHSLGKITTPAAGGSDTSGGFVPIGGFASAAEIPTS